VSAAQGHTWKGSSPRVLGRYIFRPCRPYNDDVFTRSAKFSSRALRSGPQQLATIAATKSLRSMSALLGTKALHVNRGEELDQNSIAHDHLVGEGLYIAGSHASAAAVLRLDAQWRATLSIGSFGGLAPLKSCPRRCGAAIES